MVRREGNYWRWIVESYRLIECWSYRSLKNLQTCNQSFFYEQLLSVMICTISGKFGCVRLVPGKKWSLSCAPSRLADPPPCTHWDDSLDVEQPLSSEAQRRLFVCCLEMLTRTLTCISPSASSALLSQGPPMVEPGFPRFPTEGYTSL